MEKNHWRIWREDHENYELMWIFRYIFRQIISHDMQRLHMTCKLLPWLTNCCTLLTSCCHDLQIVAHHIYKLLPWITNCCTLHTSCCHDLQIVAHHIQAVACDITVGRVGPDGPSPIKLTATGFHCVKPTLETRNKTNFHGFYRALFIFFLNNKYFGAAARAQVPKFSDALTSANLWDVANS